MYRLSYLSKTEESINASDFHHLVTHADRRNLNVGIGGYLCYMEPVFFHYLEGESDAVLQLMQTIQNDQRHSVLTIVDLGDSDTRLFPDGGLVGEMSKHKIRPILADLLLNTHKFIYGDGQLRQLALNMVAAVADQQSLLQEVIEQAEWPQLQGHGYIRKSHPEEQLA